MTHGDLFEVLFSIETMFYPCQVVSSLLRRVVE